MRLFFTRLQEEITTVKKSVTHFGVETSRPRVKSEEFSVIEITPEPQIVEHGESSGPLKEPPDKKKIPLALKAKADGIRDVVDIQGVSKRSALGPVTYSASRVLMGNPYPKKLGDSSFFDTDNRYDEKNISVYQKSGDSIDFSEPDERRALFQYTTRKFTSTQEMIEYHTAQEKRITFELTI